MQEAQFHGRNVLGKTKQALAEHREVFISSLYVWLWAAVSEFHHSLFIIFRTKILENSGLSYLVAIVNPSY